MVSFESDYIAGAHPEILKRLTETNLEPLSGYGVDIYCESAKEKIKKACDCEDAEVEFLVGGTQTNAIVISSLLKDYEGVIAAETGHVSLHEAGAIEYTGHKVFEIYQEDGKMSASDIKQFIDDFYADANHEHMVFPGMIYISYPTEYGSLYTKQELTEISEIAHTYQIPLFIDGARLGYGLMSYQSDLSLADIAKLSDVFYIGGTKVGALCGEAIVFTKKNKPPHFVNFIKKRGALLAKGRLLGVQFDTLFTNNLYFDISRHAIDMAEQLKQILNENHMEFSIKSPTNQIFVTLEDEYMETLRKYIKFGFWEKLGEKHTLVRFATSWSTTQQDLEILRNVLQDVNLVQKYK